MIVNSNIKSKKQKNKEFNQEFNKYKEKTQLEKLDIFALIIASFTTFFLFAILVTALIFTISITVFT